MPPPLQECSCADGVQILDQTIDTWICNERARGGDLSLCRVRAALAPTGRYPDRLICDARLRRCWRGSCARKRIRDRTPTRNLAVAWAEEPVGKNRSAGRTRLVEGLGPLGPSQAGREFIGNWKLGSLLSGPKPRNSVGQLVPSSLHALAGLPAHARDKPWDR